MSNNKKVGPPETHIGAAHSAIAVGAGGSGGIGMSTTTATAILTGAKYRPKPHAGYTKEQWIEVLKEYEQYPEAIEAMKVLSSKLNRSLK
jgi:hypothetical protein